MPQISPRTHVRKIKDTHGLELLEVISTDIDIAGFHALGEFYPPHSTSAIFTKILVRLTLGLEITAHSRILGSVLLLRGSLLLLNGCLTPSTKQHVAQSVSDGRADSDGSSSCSHLCEETGLSLLSLSLLRMGTIRLGLSGVCGCGSLASLAT